MHGQARADTGRAGTDTGVHGSWGRFALLSSLGKVWGTFALLSNLGKVWGTCVFLSNLGKVSGHLRSCNLGKVLGGICAPVESG